MVMMVNNMKYQTRKTHVFENNIDHGYNPNCVNRSGGKTKCGLFYRYLTLCFA
jgi:hypothetical protein